MIKSVVRTYILFAIGLFSHLNCIAQNPEPNSSQGYYNITTLPIPEEAYLEVGGLAFDGKGRLGVTTRRGEVWLIENPATNDPIFIRYASGLHEPLGLTYSSGSFYLAQRGELTKLTDTNGDNRADIYENIYTWDLAGNYHEYAYGPLFLPNGNMLVWLNLGWVGRGASLSKWSGWVMEITPDGEMTPLSTGMRSPAGLGKNAAGDLFYTENQGDWVGSGRMTHIEKGDFLGHPEGLKWTGEPESPLSLTMEEITENHAPTLYLEAQKNPALKPPSVWFPHTLMGISTSDIAVIPEGWGPFERQLLVGDQGHSKIMRVYQEKVNGVYQGICFPFVEGFDSGVLRMEWGLEKKTLYVGMTNRGWSSTGKAPFGIQKLNWTGRTPFEMQKVNITKDGFEITFTKNVDRRTAANPESYSITDFTYKYHRLYGSPPIDQQERTVYKVEVDQDNRTVRLYVEGLRLGYINEIKSTGVRSAQGDKVLHNVGYYTINEIPEFTGSATSPMADMDHSEHGASMEKIEIKSDKRITEMPSSWSDGPDVRIEIKAIPGMLYDKEEIRVKAGQKVMFTFNNPDDMMHNWILTNPDKANEVAAAALDLGLMGMEKGFIPQSDQILAHTNLLQPNTKDLIYFTAPTRPGRYQYVCTFPGHAALMRGVLIVE